MAGLEAGIPVYTGSGLSNTVRTAGLAREAAADEYASARSAAAFRLTAQWLSVLLRRKLSEAAAGAVSAAEAELGTARMLKEKGMVLGSDYYGAEAILSSFRGYSLESEKALRLEMEKLGLALGRGEVDAAGELSEAGYPGTDWGPTVNASGRRDIKALERAAEMAEIGRESAANSLLPVVEAFGTLEANSRTSADLRGNHLLGLRISVPLGDPGYFARKAAAAAASSSALSRLEHARVQAETERASALANYRTAVEGLAISRETLRNARLSLDLFRPLYRQGRQSVLETLRAQAAVFQAETAYYENLHRIALYHAQALPAVDALDDNAVARISASLSAK